MIATETLVVDRAVMLASAEQENGIARELFAHVANEVHRMQSHLLLLKRSASERVAMFLLEMSERLQLSDKNGLPMSRDDIADYLGLRSETVSRILSRLEKESVIALRTPRHIVLRDRAGLERMLD